MAVSGISPHPKTGHAWCQVYRLADIQRIYWVSASVIRLRQGRNELPQLAGSVVKGGIWSRAVIWADLGLALPAPVIADRDDTHLTIDRVATLLGVAQDTASRFVHEKVFASRRLGAMIVVAREDIESWLGDPLRQWSARDDDLAFAAIAKPDPQTSASSGGPASPSVEDFAEIRAHVLELCDHINTVAAELMDVRRQMLPWLRETIRRGDVTKELADVLPDARQYYREQHPPTPPEAKPNGEAPHAL